jgi:hypothetical protein
MRELTFGFHKVLGTYRVATELAASRVVLSSIELVIVLVGIFMLGISSCSGNNCPSAGRGSTAANAVCKLILYEGPLHLNNRKWI